MISNSYSAPQWFALRVKSNREKVTAQALSGKGYEVFLPAYQKAGARRPGESPLFPGYLFTRFDVNDRLPILVLPGVVHIVGLGKKGITSTRGLVHDAAHVAAFLSAFLIAAGQSKSWNRAFLWAVALVAFGALLEFLQTAVYRNVSLEYADILDDAIGVTAGLCILASVRPRRSPIIEK